MTLYHFTHPLHLPSIFEERRLRTTESNISINTLDAGPRVVWLTDLPDVTGDGKHPLYLGLYEEKRRIRFEVDVPGIPWKTWTHTARMDPDWRRTFVEGAGGEDVADHWFIWPAAIRANRWRSIRDVVAGVDIPIPTPEVTP